MPYLDSVVVGACAEGALGAAFLGDPLIRRPVTRWWCAVCRRAPMVFEEFSVAEVAHVPCWRGNGMATPRVRALG